MTMKKKKLPIGIENFEELQKEEFYYVDKTSDQGFTDAVVKSKSFYAPAQIWKIFEYEYAEIFL